MPKFNINIPKNAMNNLMTEIRAENVCMGGDSYDYEFEAESEVAVLRLICKKIKNHITIAEYNDEGELK